MTWAWLVGGLVLVALGLVFAIGAVLPREHVATGTVLIAADPETVWNTIRSVRAAPGWRPSVTRVELQEGPPEAPTAWIEFSGRDGLALRVEAEQRPERVVTRIANESLPFGGTWTIELSPEAEGTRVRVTERGFVKSAPFRFIAKFFIGHHASLRTYLRDLAAGLGSRTAAVS